VCGISQESYNSNKGSKLDKVKQEINEVKGVMIRNIGKAVCVCVCVCACVCVVWNTYCCHISMIVCVCVCVCLYVCVCVCVVVTHLVI